MQSYAVNNHSDKHKKTENFKKSIHDDVDAKSEKTNQRLDQDNFCIDRPGVNKPMMPNKTEGDNNEATGFNNQSKTFRAKP